MTFGELTNILLYENENYGTIHQCVHMLHDFYASITGITAEQTSDRNLFLPNGKAISPGQAANCLLDLRRTTTFLRGIHKAILKLQQNFPGQPLNVLYAGCGPYATLLTPLTTIFTPDQVRFHLVDVHQESLNAVEKLYAHLQTSNYIEALICQDASTYRMEKPMHLVICEAMQSALEKEPQVAITLNLVPQLQLGAIFIPQEVKVTAHLLDRDQEMNSFFEGAAVPERIFLGNVYAISQDACLVPEPVSLDIPPAVSSFNEIYLLTEVTVFEDERLTIYNCGVTLPKKLADVNGEGSIMVGYEMGARPGFRLVRG